MPTDLQNLSNIHEAQARAAGGKARGLSQLLAAGFPVPPGWVVLPTAFARDNLTAGARQEIMQAIATRHAQQPRVAFAGMFQTILNVSSPQAILEAVKTVYASRHEAAPYRRTHGLDEAQIMAVIIQELIPADCAGVCLTVDPVVLRADQMVINAAWGLGAGVMDSQRYLLAGIAHIDHDPTADCHQNHSAFIGRGRHWGNGRSPRPAPYTLPAACLAEAHCPVHIGAHSPLWSAPGGRVGRCQ